VPARTGRVSEEVGGGEDTRDGEARTVASVGVGLMGEGLGREIGTAVGSLLQPASMRIARVAEPIMSIQYLEIMVLSPSQENGFSIGDLHRFQILSK
jgi:hypothetical protein